MCQNFILDGHFCLLNALGEVQHISYDIFTMLRPDAIVLLTENPEIIASRRRKRDGIEVAVEGIEHFQREEWLYADEVARDINVKHFVSEGAKDLIRAIDFIKSL